MGLTCATLHVFSPDASSATPKLPLEELMRVTGDRLGFDCIDNSGEADRELIAVSAPPWVTLLDLSNPDAVTEEFTGLGKKLSEVSKRPVLLTAVWDSDVFGFLLFENGKQVDGYASGRGLLPGRTKNWPPEKRAQEWSRTFERPIGADELQTLSEKALLFADDLLARLCGLVGLPVEHATRVSRDLETQPLPNQQRYFFRSRPQPGGALPVKQKLAYKEPTLTRQIVVGKDVSSAFELNGRAAAFVDPVLEFSGSAIDSGIVTVTQGEGHWSLGIEHVLAGGMVRFVAEITNEEANGRRVFRARLKGLSAEQRSFPPRKKSILSFWYTLHGVKPGTGEIQVNFLPIPQASARLPIRPLFLVEVVR
jgi:hypothetical protein